MNNLTICLAGVVPRVSRHRGLVGGGSSGRSWEPIARRTGAEGPADRDLPVPTGSCRHRVPGGGPCSPPGTIITVTKAARSRALISLLGPRLECLSGARTSGTGWTGWRIAP